jgi:hypothetical protein
MCEHFNEQVIAQIKDTIEHKKLVMDIGFEMSVYLFNNGKKDLASQLINRVIVHDNSKFDDEELYGLASISNKSALTNPNVLLSNSQEEIVKLHWKNNRHHPEYFDDITDMTEVDILEMCCDWYSRSVQYNTDLLDFVYIRQNNRFHFPDDMFDMILNYCKILLSFNLEKKKKDS